MEETGPFDRWKYVKPIGDIGSRDTSVLLAGAHQQPSLARELIRRALIVSDRVNVMDYRGHPLAPAPQPAVGAEAEYEGLYEDFTKLAEADSGGLVVGGMYPPVAVESYSRALSNPGRVLWTPYSLELALLAESEGWGRHPKGSEVPAPVGRSSAFSIRVASTFVAKNIEIPSSVSIDHVLDWKFDQQQSIDSFLSVVDDLADEFEYIDEDRQVEFYVKALTRLARERGIFEKKLAESTVLSSFRKQLGVTIGAMFTAALGGDLHIAVAAGGVAGITAALRDVVETEKLLQREPFAWVYGLRREHRQWEKRQKRRL